MAQPKQDKYSQVSVILASIKKWFVLVFLLSICILFYYFDLHKLLTYETLRTYQHTAQLWTITHFKTAIFLYILIFSLLIACTIPCATLMTLLGGLLFGGIAIVYAVCGITLGGVILFFAVRSAIGENIATASNHWIKKMEKGFQKNAFNYLLMLRLMPIFPCWISNVSAGALNVPLRTFVAATVIGVLPATCVYVLVGRGLDRFFAENQAPGLDLLLTPSLFFPLLGLAFLSLFPVIYRHMRKNRSDT